MAAEEPAARRDDIAWTERPCTPIVVEVVWKLISMDVVATNAEWLHLRVKLELYWVDPRLVGRPLAQGVPPEIWRPDTTGCPGLKMEAAERGELRPSFFSPKPGDTASDGRLELIVPITLGEEGWNLAESNLRRMENFPFDGLRVDLSVTTAGPRREVDTDVEFSFRRPNISDDAVARGGKWQQLDWNCSGVAGDYRVTAISIGRARHPPPAWYRQPHHAPGAQMRNLVLSLHLQRCSYFYVWKGIIPLYLIAVYGFVTFAMDPADLGDRCGVLSGLFLTSFAVQFVSVERLPRLPFATTFDQVTNSVMATLAVMVVGQCVAYQLGVGGSWSMTDESPFDRRLATTVDYAVAACSLCYLACYSLLYRVVYCVRHSRRTSGANARWRDGPFFRNRWVADEGWRVELNERFHEAHRSKFLGMGEPVVEPEVNF